MPQRVEFGVNHNGETALQSAHPEHDAKLLPEFRKERPCELAPVLTGHLGLTKEA